MRRPSTLDRMVRDFQHNWETSPQFRAMWSGGLGLAIVVMLCACLGFAFTVSGSIASRFSTSGSSNPYTSADGTPHPGGVDSTTTFPTETVPSWPAPQIPAGVPIPPSTTPQPTPTAMPTATPVPFNPGGGGGGGGGGGCGNCSVNVTGFTLKGGAPGSVQISTSVPNATVNIFINWPNGTSSPTNVGTTDGSGNGTVTTTPVPSGCSGQVKLWIKTDVSGTNTVYEPCTP